RAPWPRTQYVGFWLRRHPKELCCDGRRFCPTGRDSLVLKCNEKPPPLRAGAALCRGAWCAQTHLVSPVTAGLGELWEHPLPEQGFVNGSHRLTRLTLFASRVSCQNPSSPSAAPMSGCPYGPGRAPLGLPKGVGRGCEPYLVRRNASGPRGRCPSSWPLGLPLVWRSRSEEHTS